VAKTTPTALWPSVVVTGSAVWSVPGRNAGGQSGLSGRRVWIFSTTSGNNLEDKRAIMKGDASRSEWNRKYRPPTTSMPGAPTWSVF